MLKNITELGPKEAQFISLFATKNNGFFLLEEAVKFWKSMKLTYDILWRLEKKGWIERIERGKYLIIPLEAGPQRKWSADSYVVASFLAEPAAIAYWTAIRHWNWTEQIPRVVYVQTTKRKSRAHHTIFGVEYEIITVSKRKFFGHTKEWRNGKACLITDKEKTLIDCADYVERSGSIMEFAKAVREASGEISWARLDDYAQRFPNGAVKKRLGYLFEKLVPQLPGEAKNMLGGWQQGLTKGISALNPAGPKSGKISTHWKILINTEI
jgi:predicted transcriptional regulator of viral defense system